MGKTQLEIRIGKAPGRPRGVVLIAVLLLGQVCAVRPLWAAAPAGTINSVVGQSNGDGYPAEVGKATPGGLALDPSGNLYLADQNNYAVRWVDQRSGIIDTVPGLLGVVVGAYDVTFDTAGQLYVVDYFGNRVWQRAASGGWLVVAGTGSAGFGGDDGAATAARLNSPTAVAVDLNGNVYISDTSNGRVRRVDALTKVITTVAGGGSVLGDNGPATQAKLGYAQGIGVDGQGNLYIADTYQQRIRRVDSRGIITTVAGNGIASSGGDGGPATSAQLTQPTDVAVDRSTGDLYIADSLNDRIRWVQASTGFIFTLAGTYRGLSGDGGPASQAQLNNPHNVALGPSGDLWIADTGNDRVRQVVFGSAAAATPTPTVGSFGVAGLIHYYNNPSLAVPEAVVQLQNMTTGTTAAAAQTDSTGQFVFSGIGPGNWQLQPLKTGDVGRAVDIQDAIAILEATVGLSTLTVQQQLACDVSGDNSVNIADAVRILEYAVGLISRFPVARTCNSDWAFVPEPAPAANQHILKPQISAGSCRNGAIAFEPLAAQANNQNFSALLFGDCTGSWQASSPRIAALSVAPGASGEVRIGRHLQRHGPHLRVPVSVKAESFRGLIVQLGYDPVQVAPLHARPVANALMQANL